MTSDPNKDRALDIIDFFEALPRDYNGKAVMTDGDKETFGRRVLALNPNYFSDEYGTGVLVRAPELFHYAAEHLRDLMPKDSSVDKTLLFRCLIAPPPTKTLEILLDRVTILPKDLNTWKRTLGDWISHHERKWLGHIDFFNQYLDANAKKWGSEHNVHWQRARFDLNRAWVAQGLQEQSVRQPRSTSALRETIVELLDRIDQDQPRVPGATHLEILGVAMESDCRRKDPEMFNRIWAQAQPQNGSWGGILHEMCAAHQEGAGEVFDYTPHITWIFRYKNDQLDEASASKSLFEYSVLRLNPNHPIRDGLWRLVNQNAFASEMMSMGATNLAMGGAMWRAFDSKWSEAAALETLFTPQTVHEMQEVFPQAFELHRTLQAHKELTQHTQDQSLRAAHSPAKKM